ncbi:hypothetical protein BD626DRAFT_488978 [Schizophyllum amplum]|uniref:Xylulose kinase n=1 Tax=Schizophyllum amplum TaxID=97359 RepID=A0A550CL26_9AGAR|nr:hypothetical protein BD626DRAFT_488978 [Auriculariopsis ampla]
MAGYPENPLFFGLDLSTQQLKGILISQDACVVHESAVHFESDLAHYGTVKGAIPGPNGEATSPVAMWLEAYDLLMARMREAGVDFSSIVAISGSGQQHGSVYWSAEAEKLLSSLDTDRPLTQLAPGAFSWQRAPIWQDSSTTRECRELEAAVGGAQQLADLTGSRGYERFTGTQIKKLRRVDPATYNATVRISLVSSFMHCLFLGSIAPIEISDASGMNLMNVLSCKWEDVLLEAAGGPELRAKLGPEPCIVAPFTGDNPATVIGLSAPGDAILSLGTSTTFLLSIPPSDAPPKCFTTSHILSHPTTLDSQIAMLCYKNGALAREQVRDRTANADWSKYNELVEARPAGNDGDFGSTSLAEIIPPNSITPEAAPRAVVESQFLSILSRIAAILPANAPPLQRLVISGGSSANPTIRQLAADVFGMKVYVSSTKEAAALGGALLAKYAWWKGLNEGEGTFEEMSGGEVPGMKCVAEPNADPHKVYMNLVDAYRWCEADVVRKGTIPA